MLDDMSESNDPSFSWRKDITTGGWTEALEYASKQLLTSRTSVRVPFLHEHLLTLVKNEGTYLPNSKVTLGHASMHTL